MEANLDKVMDMKIAVRSLKGNSVNLYSTDKLIEELLLCLESLPESLSDQVLIEEILELGEKFKTHMQNLEISSTANVWAERKHKEQTEIFSHAFSLFKSYLN